MESRTLDDASGAKYMIVLFSRRSRLHPGTRYIARGLNSLASPGNEIECEQVLFESLKTIIASLLISLHVIPPVLWSTNYLKTIKPTIHTVLYAF